MIRQQMIRLTRMVFDAPMPREAHPDHITGVWMRCRDCRVVRPFVFVAVGVGQGAVGQAPDGRVVDRRLHAGLAEHLQLYEDPQAGVRRLARSHRAQEVLLEGMVVVGDDGVVVAAVVFMLTLHCS